MDEDNKLVSGLQQQMVERMTNSPKTTLLYDTLHNKSKLRDHDILELIDQYPHHVNKLDHEEEYPLLVASATAGPKQ
jgi:hypothetical protein